MKTKHIAALLLAAVIFLCSCSVINTDTSQISDTEPAEITAEATESTELESTEPAQTEPAVTLKDYYAAAPDEIDGGIRTEYSNLDTLGKNLYLELDEAFKEYKYVFNFPVDSIEDPKYPINVFRSYLFDHPEVFILSGYTTYRDYRFGKIDYYQYSYKMVMSIGEYNNMLAQLEERVNEIVSEAEKLPTDYDKAKYVHDVIIASCTYDDESADFILNMSDDNPFEYNPSVDNPFLSASTAYGCLVEGKAICSGYIDAYQLIMQRLGITCGKTLGKADGVNHIWNRILLDGNYYYVDVTWDDSSEIPYPQ